MFGTHISPLLGVLITFATSATVAAPTITNPDFEANGPGFTVGSGWTAFGSPSGKWEGIWYPEYTWSQGVSEIPSGQALGIYQQVGPTVPGRQYTLRIQARLTDDRLRADVGIDPAGGTNPANAQYGSETGTRNAWVALSSAPVVAAANTITLFLRGRNTYHIVINGAWVIFDQVRLEEVELVATPTPTPPGPTVTPTRTPTGPTPTFTRTPSIPAGVVAISAEEFYQRAYGMWKGQLAGVQLGAQYEFDWIDQPSPGDSVPLPTWVEFSRVDDDNWFEWMYLYFVQEHGWGMGYAIAGQEWRQHFTRLLAGANEEARGLLNNGYNPPQTGMRGYNSKWFFIDAQIESEAWGTMAAGMGGRAKSQADVWARVTNDGGAVDAATFYAIMYAYGMIEPDIRKVLRAAQTHYPANAEVSRLVDRVFQEVAQRPTDWRGTRQALRDYTWNPANFEGYVSEHRGIFWATNFAAVLTALLYGDRDYHRAQQLSILQGYDADCNSSTTGGMMGTLVGHDNIPPAYRDYVTDNYHNWNGAVTQAPSMDALSSMAFQALRMFERNLAATGGWSEGTGWKKVYYIRTDWPASIPRSTQPPQATPTYTPAPGPPVLRNGNMEQTAYGGIWLPDAWIAFGGNKFEQQWHAGSQSKAAGLAEIPGTVRPYIGIYQRVYGAVPGHRYRVEADVWQNPTVYRASIGIDPQGWLDYEANVYGAEIAGNGRVFCTAVAQDSRLTVFIRIRNISGSYNSGWAYVDNVTLVDEGAAITQTPTPTVTPTLPLADADGDQIADSNEDGHLPAAGRTNRYLPDSDGDGLHDGVEDANRNGTRDPGETNARSRDSDGDAFQDGLEGLLLHTDPLNGQSPGGTYVDSDNDGLPLGLDLNDADRDMDDDRFLDGYEAVVLGPAAVTNPGQRPTLADTNHDTFITNVDALLIQMFFAELVSFAQYPGMADGDLNRDGAQTNVDALIVQSFFLQLVAELPL